MIPTAEKTLDVDNFLGAQSESVEFRIDLASMAHLMGVLTNLYSDPMLAIIREYSTNARDAHIAAGKPNVPIEITLPNTWSDTFIVKDHGVGMSYDDIVRIYTSYGSSTKRDTNEQTGMLGLGSKSALTYAQQFTLVATKDGERVVVLINKNENGIPVANVVDRRQIDAPNGVEVKIPISRYDISDFVRTANEFFSFWEEGIVLIDGQAPKSFGVDLGDDMMLAPFNNSSNYYSYGNFYIVMGNVPYKMKSSSIRVGHVFLRVPIGTFSIAPSREALIETDALKGSINKLERKAYDAVRKYVINEVNNAPDLLSAYKLYKKYKGFQSDIPSTWNGYDLSDSFYFQAKYDQHGLQKAGVYNDRIHPSLDNVISGKYLFITESPESKRKDTIGPRLEALEQFDGIYFLGENADDEKRLRSLPVNLQVMKWDDFKAIKPKSRPVKPAPVEKSFLITGSGYYYEVRKKESEIAAMNDGTNEFLWFVTSTENKFTKDKSNALARLFPGRVIIAAPKSAQKVLDKIIPGIENAKDKVKQSFDKDQALLDSALIDPKFAEFVSEIDDTTFSDPRLNDLVLLYQEANKKAKEISSATNRSNYYRAFGFQFRNNGSGTTENSELMAYVSTEYPLIEYVGFYQLGIKEKIKNYVEMIWRNKNDIPALDSH